MCKSHPLEALLHDATEAYLGDVPKPAKLLCPEYQFAENRLAVAIGKRFGVTLHPLPAEVKTVDEQLLFSEHAYLQPRGPAWSLTTGLDTEEARISLLVGIWESERAAMLFVRRFKKLTEVCVG